MDGSGSDSDSGSSASSAGADVAVDFHTFEEAIASNPFDASLHANLIKALQKAGPSHCEQLAAARERMAASLALTSDLWLEWIDDDVSLAASQEDLDKVESLFRRAAADAPAPEIFLSWTKFLDKNFDDGEFDAAVVARMRAVHEDALGCMGLNVAAGGKLWDAAMAFERRLASSVQSLDTSVVSEAKSKLLSLVKRRFSLPLDGMQAAALALDAPLPPEVQPAYNVALNLLAARSRFETQVAAASAEAWIAYNPAPKYSPFFGS